MLRDEKLQLAGPISLVGAIWCAEIAAHALATWPSSPFLWYLNLEVFQSFRYNFEGLGGSQWLGSSDGLAQWIWLPVPLVGLVCKGQIARLRLPLAVASNLSFIYSAALFCSSFVSGIQSSSYFLAAGIMVVSFVSSLISHRNYWREIFS
jgi:hypothetical protein